MMEYKTFLGKRKDTLIRQVEYLNTIENEAIEEARRELIIEKLAKDFQVTKPLMEVRLVKLGHLTDQ